MMKKTLVTLAVSGAVTLGTNNALAALASDATLTIVGATSGGLVQPTSGSWFSMAVGDINFDGVPDILYVPVNGFNGLKLGTIQESNGSHSGPPDGTESPNIDQPWNFFNNTGMHETKSASNVLSASGNNATIDFSGWFVDWNGVEINMGNTAWGGNPNGVANVQCSGGDANCGVGSLYTLDYTATVPDDGSTNFGNVQYGLHLEGTVVPVPAAVWLFGSGLLGLIGIARRRTA